jgi:hypothetical protein
MKKTLLTALAVVLAGCAADDKPWPSGIPAPTGRKAGVISLMGERPAYVHLTAPAPSGSGEYVMEPAQAWQTDFFTETVVGRRVASHGYDPVPAVAGREAFASLQAFRPAAPTQPLDFSGVRAELQKFVAREQLELVVIVSPVKLPPQYSGTLDVYGGYGKWSQGRQAGCFATVRVTVIDARELKFVKQETGSRMSRKANDPLVAKHLGELSDANKEDMRDCMLDAIDSAIESAMFRMGL